MRDVYAGMGLSAHPAPSRSESPFAKSNDSRTCATLAQVQSLLCLARCQGGGGCLLHGILVAHRPSLIYHTQGPAAAISFASPAYENLTRNSIVSPAYAKTGGYTPPQKCRRADIFDFSPDFSRFFTSASPRRSHPAQTPSHKRAGMITSAAPTGSAGRAELLFFWLRRLLRRPLAAGRNDVLQPHVRDQVAVMLHVVHVVHGQRAEPRRVIPEKLDRL